MLIKKCNAIVRSHNIVFSSCRRVRGNNFATVCAILPMMIVTTSEVVAASKVVLDF